MGAIDYNVIKIALEKSPFNKYECVLNVPYSDEYSETLDSMSVVIKHIDLKLDINPFDVVYIYRGVVKGGTIHNPTYTDIKWKEMLVDSVSMLRKRYGNNTYYEYTLKLMSETKWLEKIQLPNRSFTHALGGELRDAYETIKDLMTYVPKVIRNNEETPLITISEAVEGRFLNHGMKDMSLNKPTLRQALTAVMSQFGCIPVVNNKQLGFIDFNRSQGNITEEQIADMDSESYSNSSDSYVNTLMTDASQVLGDDKSLVVERGVGFRDRDTGLIKQQENLKLFTTYPIYKVKNLTINMNLSTYPCIIVKVYNIADADYFILPSSNPEGNFNPVVIYDNISEYVVKVYCGSRRRIKFSNWTFKILEVINPSTSDFRCEGFKTSSVKTGISQPAESQWAGGTMYTFSISKNGMVRPDGTVAYLFIAKTNDDRYIVWNTYVEDNGNGTVISGMYKELEIGIVYRKVSVDITSLVKTAQERKLLSYDYTTDEFKNGQGNMAVYSKYYYTTVQYKLGGNEISGWSDKYTEAQGWWDVNKTTIENIVNKSFYENEFFNKRYDNIFNEEDILPYPQWFYSYKYVDGNGNEHPVAEKSIFSRGWVDDMFGSYNYPSRISFNISYQPLNDLNIATVKSNFDYPLAQLDSRDNGLVDFGNFKKVEQDKLDRLGNGVHIFSKRYFAKDGTIDLESKLIPLGAVHVDTGEVVFKRMISFKNNYIDIAYYLCKDYVIANYSTSITTKYRAYQYVDYSSSTFRNENRISYFTISEVYNSKVDYEEKDVLGDTEKYWGGVATMGDSNLDYLCSGMIFAPFLYNNNVRSMNMGYRRVKSTAYSNDNPIVSYSVFQQATSHYLYDYGLVVSFKYWDTVSPGIMLESTVRATGFPQHPYMYNDKSSVVKYANEQDIGLMAVPSDNGWTSQAESSAEYAQTYPAITDSEICVNSFINIAYMSFDISDIIQDQSELMGFTMQIEYRSLTNNVVVFKDISKAARIFNDDENPLYTYKPRFFGTYEDAVQHKFEVLPCNYSEVLDTSENKIFVKNDVTIYYGDAPLISMKKGTYYVRLSKYNKKVNIKYI
nr:MAG TPA: hypothetical protein [Caudoviricetes sp.]